MKNIIKGWKKYEADTDIPQHRIDAVRDCPNRKEAKIKALRLKDRYPETSSMICSNCFCPLPTKLRVENCNCNEYKKH